MAAWSLILAPAPVDNFAPHHFKARVEETRCGEKSQHATVTILQIDANICRPFRVSLTVTDIVPQLEPSTLIELSGELQPVDRYGRIPYMGMSEQTDRANRISARLVVMPEDVRLVGNSNSIWYVFDRIQNDIAEKFYASGLTPRAATLLVASCLGTGDADIKSKERFRISGLSHLLCISGFHVGVLAAVVSLLFMPLRLLSLRNRRLWRYLPPLVIVWLYALVVGFTAPIVRAAVMISAYTIAKMIQREPKPANTLCIAFVLVLLVNPYWLFSVGFQLSFSAVVGLLLFANRLNPVSRRYKVAHGIAGLLAVPLAAMLGTLPVMLVWFHRVPLLTIPINAIASLVFPLFMIGGVLAVTAGSSGLGIVLCNAINGLYSLIDNTLGAVTDRTAHFCIEYSPGTVSLIAIVTAVIAIAYSLHCNVFRERTITCTIAACSLLCIGIENVVDSKKYYLVIDGDSRGSKILLATAGSDPIELPQQDITDVDGLRIGVLRGTSEPGEIESANILLLSRTFRGNLTEFIDASKAEVVVIGADLDYNRRRAYELVCRREGIIVYPLSQKAYIRSINRE